MCIRDRDGSGSEEWKRKMGGCMGRGIDGVGNVCLCCLFKFDLTSVQPKVILDIVCVCVCMCVCVCIGVYMVCRRRLSMWW